MENKTNTFAILSLIFAFLVFPLGFIFGIIALSQIKKTKERGKGLATAGILISLIPIILLILIGLSIVFMSRVSKFSVVDIESVAEKKSYTKTKEEWDFDKNKKILINELNRIKDSLGWTEAVEVTKLTEENNLIDIHYMQITADFQKNTIAITMFEVLKTTINFLEDYNAPNYDIQITTTTSNSGLVFFKKTSAIDIEKIKNYEMGLEEWTNEVIPIK